MDIRHKPTADDVTMHTWFRESGCPEIVLANKLDKLKKSQVEPALALIRETLDRWIDFSGPTISDALIEQFILQVIPYAAQSHRRPS